MLINLILVLLALKNNRSIDRHQNLFLFSVIITAQISFIGKLKSGLALIWLFVHTPTYLNSVLASLVSVIGNGALSVAILIKHYL